MPGTSSGEQDDILQKLEALTSANVCTDPTRLLRDAKELAVLLQNAPLPNREHLETAVRVHGITLGTAKKYDHAIKFFQLATQLAKEPEFKELDRGAHIIKHLATPFALHACTGLWQHLQPTFLGLPELFKPGLLS